MHCFECYSYSWQIDCATNSSRAYEQIKHNNQEKAKGICVVDDSIKSYVCEDGI